MKENELCRIMRVNTSDKSTGHNYTKLYHLLFRDRRQFVRNVFEIGIGPVTGWRRNYRFGASLRGWREYFPNAMVYGADVNPVAVFQENRIRTFVCDKMNPDQVAGMWDQIGNVSFDLMVDDSLHTAESDIIFMRRAIHKLAPDGVYIIEDILESHKDLFHNLIHTFCLENPEFNYFAAHMTPSRQGGNNRVAVITRGR